jgi:hypothetical protein
MSYWLEDSRENYLGDLSTNKGIVEMREMGIPSLNKFLDDGEADKNLIQQISKDIKDNAALLHLVQALEKAEPPIFVTDGCGHEDSN